MCVCKQETSRAHSIDVCDAITELLAIWLVNTINNAADTVADPNVKYRS